MKMPEASFFEWQRQFGSETNCLNHIKQLRWPTGFICPRCSCEHGYELTTRDVYECSQCHKQTSVTADTLFHGSRISLTKWFWAIYFLGSDKGSISALRLCKLIEANWRTARLILSKLRTAMGHRDSLYRLTGVIEIDDAFVGGKRKGKRGRGAEGKMPVLVAVESKGKRAGFIAMQAVNSVYHDNVEKFVAKHLGTIETVAGTGVRGFSGDSELASNAELAFPKALDIAQNGDLYIADAGNNVIRKVDKNGIITTVAGNGSSGFSGDGGLATQAQLYGPEGVV
jgi:hypothetical protein